MGNQLWTFMALIVGMVLLFQFAGLTTEGGITIGTYHMNGIGGFTNFKVGSLWDYITNNLGSLILLGGISIAAAWAGKVDAFTSFKIGFVSTVLFDFLSDLIGVVNTVEAMGGFGSYLIILICAPLMFGFAMAGIQWIGGTD